MSKINKIFEIFAITISLLFSFSLFVFTPMIVKGEESTKTQTSKDKFPCPPEITNYFNQQSVNFGAAIESIFLRKEANSGLIEEAVTAYRTTRFAMRKHLEKTFTGQQGRPINFSLAIYHECSRTLEEDYIKGMLDKLFTQQVQITAQAKKTTILVDKLDSINKKLRETSTKVGIMQGYFSSFEKKVPCLLKTCQK